MAPYAVKEWGGGQIFDPGAYTARIKRTRTSARLG